MFHLITEKLTSSNKTISSFSNAGANPSPTFTLQKIPNPQHHLLPEQIPIDPHPRYPGQDADAAAADAAASARLGGGRQGRAAVEEVCLGRPCADDGRVREPVAGERVDALVSWSGHSNLSMYADGAIALEFDVPQALYADSSYQIPLRSHCRDDPRFFSSRVVVADAGSEGQRERTRPQYYKVPGRRVERWAELLRLLLERLYKRHVLMGHPSVAPIDLIERNDEGRLLAS